MPAATVWRALERTETWLAGASPTSTTARPGVRPCSAFSPVTAAATRAVNPAAKALPSIKSASPAVLLAALLVKALSPIDLAGGASSPERRARRLSDCDAHWSRPASPRSRSRLSASGYHATARALRRSGLPAPQPRVHLHRPP